MLSSEPAVMRPQVQEAIETLIDRVKGGIETAYKGLTASTSLSLGKHGDTSMTSKAEFKKPTDHLIKRLQHIEDVNGKVFLYRYESLRRLHVMGHPCKLKFASAMQASHADCLP